MNLQSTRNAICAWMNKYAAESMKNGFVVGVSGGVDSALVSTLCAHTGRETRLLVMPIHQNPDQTRRGREHCEALASAFNNVSLHQVELTNVFEECMCTFRVHFDVDNLVAANLRSRLRMATLYSFSTEYNLLVTGTGNKVEDYGVGFFTKYGDGGVDISPIGRLTKTQVWELAEHMKVSKEIIMATPTDGLWEDGRSDEEQLGARYVDIEKAMEFCEVLGIETVEDYKVKSGKFHALMSTVGEKLILNYLQRHRKNAHKIAMPPIGPEPV